MFTQVLTHLGMFFYMTTSFASVLQNEVKSRVFIPRDVSPNYEAFSACEKQSILWTKIQNTQHQHLPEYHEFGIRQIVGLARQSLATKSQNYSDFAPAGWKKYLHAKAAVAKIRIVPTNHQYTGIFAGAECGLLRLSLTYKPTSDRAVAPGLALKVLRDGTRSANISALVSLSGQAKDYNFFKFPMSNIVPVGNDFGQKVVHTIFSRVSKYPEELLVQDMAAIDAQGSVVASKMAPRQIFFIPGREVLNFSSKEHDVRQDFLKISTGTVIYRIHAVSDGKKGYNYVTDYKMDQIPILVKESVHIADVVTTSEFVASEFGDNEIFFRHQIKK